MIRKLLCKLGFHHMNRCKYIQIASLYGEEHCIHCNLNRKYWIGVHGVTLMDEYYGEHPIKEMNDPQVSH